MARIRTIKPEFPQSETIGRLSREARLLFIQLWTIVDDDGRARASSRMLASLLYPYDDDAPSLMTGWLDELEREHCIRRYSVDGASYVDIPNWLKHQKIDRPSQSRLPTFDEGSRGLASVQRGLDADLGPRTLDHGPSITGVSLRSTPSDDVKISENLPIEKPKKPSEKNTGARLPDMFHPGADWLVFTREQGVSDDQAIRELDGFRDYWRGVAGAKGRKLDWLATWRNWIRSYVSRSSNVRGHRQGRDDGKVTFGQFAEGLANARREQELDIDGGQWSRVPTGTRTN